MTLAEKIQAEMDIDNPKPLTEEEKQRLANFNKADSDKQFWNLPYKNAIGPNENNAYKFKSAEKHTREERQTRKTAREEEAYEAGLKGKKFLAQTEREKTFYLNGKLEKEIMHEKSINTIRKDEILPYQKNNFFGIYLTDDRPVTEYQRKLRKYTVTKGVTLTLEEAKAGKTAEQKLNEFWNERNSK